MVTRPFWHTKLAAAAGIFLVLVITNGCSGDSSADSNDAGGNGSLSVSENTPAMASGVELEGEIGADTIDDDVIIPADRTTVLNGTTVEGNVFVDGGAELIALGVRIDGNVKADGAQLVDLSRQSTVDGDLQAERTDSVVVREDTLISGNVQITEAPSPEDVAALWIDSSQVDGDVQAEKSSGHLFTIDTHIGGNLQFAKNATGAYDITDNRIEGDLQFFKNQGVGTIIGNDVGGNLQSKENFPQTTIENNIVDGDLEVE